MFMKKSVLIIGGSCDIGKSLSNYFLDKDYNVVVGYYKNDFKYDNRIKYLNCDVKNKDSIETYDTEHILVEVSDTVTEEQALALANEIISKLDEGKTFAEVVEEYGDRIVHEELGFQGKTASLEQTYIDEMVALKDGEYSKVPVKTSYGYHIVHRLATSTLEDLRGTIIETLSEDLLSEDSNLTYKAFAELREEKGLEIFDEELKKQYEEYCETLNEEHNHS